MKQQILKTHMGDIAVFSNDVQNTIPIILLHGVYFDHHLWSYQTSRFRDRSIITIDMPLHGASVNNVPGKWNLADCGDMLLEILDLLNIQQVIAVGHSWGSMTILRAAHKAPERFQAVGLCNMPFEKATDKMKWLFLIMHWLLPFRNFYTKQVAKSFYGKKTFDERPELFEHLDLAMSNLNNSAIKKIDRNVITHADDATDKIATLQVPALALKGKEDYVPIPKMPTIIVEGGHVSPLEVPEDIYKFLLKVIALQAEGSEQRSVEIFL